MIDIEAADIAEYAREQYGERAGKLAYGIWHGEKSNGTVGRVTAKGNRERLQAEYGVSYDALLEAAAREYDPDVTVEDALAALDGRKGTLAQHAREHWQQRAEETDTETETDSETDESTTDSEEFVARLDDYCEERSVDYEQLTIMTDSDYNQLKRIGEREVDPEDVEDVLRERERLTEQLDLPEKECAELALSSLRRLAGDSDSLDSLSPAPRSGDIQSDDETRHSDPEKAEAIREKIEHLREHAGDSNELARGQIEMYESELEEMSS